jgi:hypothetical protein
MIYQYMLNISIHYLKNTIKTYILNNKDQKSFYIIVYHDIIYNL